LKGEDYCIVFMTAASMASLNLGMQYLLAGRNILKKFYGWIKHNEQKIFYQDFSNFSKSQITRNADFSLQICRVKAD